MKINIDLCVRNYNGGPCIKVSNNKKVLLEKRLSEKGNITLELEDDFALPNKLIIEHHGKNMKRDTQINSKGEIINDKGFFVHHISFDAGDHPWAKSDEPDHHLHANRLGQPVSTNPGADAIPA